MNRFYFNALMVISGFMLSASSVRAAEVQFSAAVDHEQVAEDESFSLKLILKSSELVRLSGDPKYSAPDFNLVSEYPSQNYETVYSNGQFSMQTTLAFTYVLRPKKRGTFKISGIELATQGGQVYRSNPITVTVTAGGAGTPPPQVYGNGGAGLRGAGKRNTGGMSFFIRAEVDKNQAYKGERIVVSYYLYTRVRIYNIRADKFPNLEGFLREELEMPIIQPRAGDAPEQVVVGGVPYQRSLLSRYAAYPLKEGKLSIDGMSLQVDYFAQGRENSPFGEDDPFAGFFNQMMPRKATATSEMVTIEVLPVPSVGRPSSFSGGIGQFTVLSSVDRSEIKTGEPVTFSVKVEGQGNLSSIEAPKINWPEGVQVYESTSHITGGKTGAGQKSFDTVLVFKRPGPTTIPAVDFSYFDPKTRSYVTLQTRPLQLSVSGSAIAEANNASTTPLEKSTNPVLDPTQQSTIQRWMSQVSPPIEASEKANSHWTLLTTGSRILAGLLLFLSSVGLGIGWTKRRKIRAPKGEVDVFDPKRVWNKAHSEIIHLTQLSDLRSDEFRKTLDSAEQVLGRVLRNRFDLDSRVYSASEFCRLLVEDKGVSSGRADAIQKILNDFQELKYSGLNSDQIRLCLHTLAEKWQNLGIEDPAFVEKAEIGMGLNDDADEVGILGDHRSL